MVSNRVCGALCFQDVLLQWLMTDGVLLNQIDAEDPEVSARAPLWTLRRDKQKEGVGEGLFETIPVL